jgi:uncharacterized membrane protein YeaQ/YmgE (transglycosylase-associated protein family)
MAIILLGMIAGFAARWLVGRFSKASFSAAEAFGAGLAGSFVGGLLASLLSGDGLDLGLSGILGSTVGAVVILGIWAAVRVRQ